MRRKDFIRKGLLGTGIFALGASGVSALANEIDELEKLEPMTNPADVGFNHIPNTNSKIMENTVLHKAATRGDANHGWLHSRHTFSFANYYNPERMHFGVLRVLNDDVVAGGMGFGTHPHDNMEIISIPLEGDLEHKDSMGNTTVIKNGDIQVMSAGTGVRHSEYNKNKEVPVKFLQIWVFPNKRDVAPRYDQITLRKEDRKNKLQQILSPDKEDAGVWIHQDAWFHLADFDKGTVVDYTFKKAGNGLYVFVLKGDMKVNGEELNTRDGFGIWDVSEVKLEAATDSEFLLMEVPMAV
ncbi:pirin family protein [Crocinitomicaceae bacterium CZZ-1]|uniref:Pirin family protein n=2 Tax=Taishania pollutisoli TaxID=2766479 RepID=A0A8J6PM11_9FLAO|nr:pirin family protein [Taishania pollutisoli]NGF76986.1 pirin family protein [Fluviicola sp. SGL-29]